MDPELWGPSAWKLLHRMAYTFDSLYDARAFFASLQHILPCAKCRNNFRSHISALGFPKNVRCIGRWVYDVHNRVNSSKNVPEDTVPTYETVRQMYSKFAMRPEEWNFIDAIIKTHAGKYHVSDEYVASLQIFLRHWCDASNVPFPDGDIRSKMALQKWFKINSMSPKSSNRVCSRTCSLSSSS
jgi:hypothetical protein